MVSKVGPSSRLLDLGRKNCVMSVPFSCLIPVRIARKAHFYVIVSRYGVRHQVYAISCFKNRQYKST